MKKVFSISSNQKNNLCATAKVLELTGLTKLFLGGLIAAHFIFARSIIATTFCATGERIILAIGTATAEIYTAFGYPQILRWGGWVFPFCRAKSGFWGPRPLQTEEPAKNVARCFLYKFRAAQKVVAMMDLEKIK
jgi:hypothetical protein